MGAIYVSEQGLDPCCSSWRWGWLYLEPNSRLALSAELGQEALVVAGSATYSTMLEARVGIEPTHKGFADLSLTTWVPRLMLASQPDRVDMISGAGNGIRTRDFDLGKVALYH